MKSFFSEKLFRAGAKKCMKSFSERLFRARANPCSCCQPVHLHLSPSPLLTILLLFLLSYTQCSHCAASKQWDGTERDFWGTLHHPCLGISSYSCPFSSEIVVPSLHCGVSQVHPITLFQFDAVLLRSTFGVRVYQVEFHSVSVSISQKYIYSKKPCSDPPTDIYSFSTRDHILLNCAA